MFSFTETPPYTESIEAMGFETMNLMLNSGSFFVILVGVLVWMSIKFVINEICKRFYKHKRARDIGVWCYESSYSGQVKQGSYKLFLESYFDLTMCQILAICGFVRAGSMLPFVQDFSNGLCTFLSVTFTILVPVFPFLAYYKLTHGDLRNKEFKRNWGFMFDELRRNDLDSLR